MANVIKGAWPRGIGAIELVDKGAPYFVSEAVFMSPDPGRLGVPPEEIWEFRTKQDANNIHDYREGESGWFFRYHDAGGGVAPATESIRRELDELNEPLVVDFINAKGRDALTKFLQTYGLPQTPEEPASALVPVWRVIQYQSLFETTLKMYRAGVTEAARGLFQKLAGLLVTLRPDIQISDTKDTLRLSLETNSLAGFMCMEAAAIITGGSRVMVCDHCGKFFMSGTDTGKRHRYSVAYCSNRCRVAAQRKRDRAAKGQELAEVALAPSDVTDLRPAAKRPLRKAASTSA